MNTQTFTDNISTIQDGKIIIPGEIQKLLGLSDGGRVMFITDGEEVRIVNPATRAFSELQEAMKGAAEEAGWTSDDDVVDYIMDMRRNSR
ncbi:MAG: AbrB/MazE/SpoVT family DNA-binding domain-containing protein [Synergistaceae bacterium]|nr:AbrB/MazE/SpoVT family DNA-binding domain-containing protein [Synergistaceae bacterium]